MPCNDGGYSEPSRKQIKNAELEKENGRLTELLCSACRTLKASGFDFATNPQLDNWWNAHQKVDLARQEAEAEAELRRQQKIVEMRKATELSARFSADPSMAMTVEQERLLKKYGLL